MFSKQQQQQPTTAKTSTSSVNRAPADKACTIGLEESTSSTENDDDDNDDDDDDGGVSMPLISFENDAFHVNPDALAVLRDIEGPIAVVAVAGMYRTGKSFLLNRVLLSPPAPAASPARPGFTVGPTTRACTKGIWMWSKPLRVRGVNVFVVDTEGIGAPTADATHDTRIFALGLLISTYFIYNSVGTIDEQALNNLYLVTRLSEHLQKTRADAASAADVDADAPPPRGQFLWVVRDFSLQLRNANNDAIGSTEYMEEVLQRCDGASDAKNEMRASLRDFFPRRDCFTLLRPCIDEAQLQNLDALPYAQLRPEFVEQAARLRAKILDEAVSHPMHMAGCVVTSAMFGMLCESYVHAVNAGQLPVLKDAWAYVCDTQRAQLEQRAVLEFSDSVQLDALAAAPHHPGVVWARVSLLRDQTLQRFTAACADMYGAAAASSAAATATLALDKTLGRLAHKACVRAQESFTRLVGEHVADALATLGGDGDGGLVSTRARFDALRDTFLLKFTVKTDDDDGDDDDATTAAASLMSLLLAWRDRYRDRDGDGDAAACCSRVFNTYATCEWGTRAVSAVWDAASARHASLEKQVREAGREAERQRAEVAGLRQELARASSALVDKGAEVEAMQARLDGLSESMVAASAESAERLATAEQATARERLRAETAELETAHLKEEVDELSSELSASSDQTRCLSDVTLERDKLSAEVEDLHAALEQERQTLEQLASDHKKESQEIQEDLLRTLRAMKENNKAEVAQLETLKDEALARATHLTAVNTTLNEELATVRAQQVDGLEAHERAVAALRAQMEENEQRLGSSLSDASARLEQNLRLLKDRERASAECAEEWRDERLKLEKERVAQVEEWKRRALQAEEELSEQRKRTANANERAAAARKRPRVNGEDADKSGHLIRAESELSHLREQKLDLTGQLKDLQKLSREQQQEIWGLQRGMDNQLTRLKIEYEHKITTLEHRLALASRST